MSNAIFQSGNKYFQEAFEGGRLVLKEITAKEFEVKKAATAAPKSTLDEMIDKKFETVKADIISSLNLADLKPTSGATQTAAFSTIETVELHDAATFEYEAEKFRWMGQSGLIGTRQYNYGGTKAYQRPFDISYTPMNIHTHSNYLGMQGMAELAMSFNGYYIRVRHNDYRDSMPHPTSGAYQLTQRVPRPTLPASVVGTVDEQKAIMRDLYVRAYNTLQENAGAKLTAAEKALFRWDMSYAEVWWEVLTEGETSDPGESLRHLNVSNDVKTMLRDAQWYNYGGHKNTNENTGYWVAAIKEVNADGTPSFAILKYRILSMPVATLAEYLPSQLYDHVKDYKSLMRGGFADFTALKNSTWGRFRIKENRDRYGLLDVLVNKIPGLDNGPGNIVETYTKYGATETIFNMTNTAANNAARYFRFGYINKDASGRSVERRGFNDPYLFVAMNTQPKVKKHTAAGIDYRFSYMIPLEMLLRHPLEVWNPHNIPEVTTVTGTGTNADPYNGVSENAYWYITPASFFDARMDADPGDTVRAGLYFRDDKGVPQNTAASGTYIFLPKITNADGTTAVPGDGIRMRWPIYPSFHEGSHAFAEVEALRDYIAAGKAVV